MTTSTATVETIKGQDRDPHDDSDVLVRSQVHCYRTSCLNAYAMIGDSPPAVVLLDFVAGLEVERVFLSRIFGARP